MSATEISKMDFKQLRSEVQLLRDELAIFKRKYEDVIYNLDSDNFSGQFLAEQGDMKAKVEVTAEAIKAMVTDTDLDTALAEYSEFVQTADAIRTKVAKEVNLDDAEEINSLSEALDVSKIYFIKSVDSGRTVKTHYFFNSVTKAWEPLKEDSIYSVFTQTAEGFGLKGNVVIDGDLVTTKNLKLSGNVTWDMSNSPVQTQYSADGVNNWHAGYSPGDLTTPKDMFMRMSFDGGKNWSTPTKVVGSDGKDGTDGWDGSDASVTPENVFNALTDNGAQQGIFAAFVNNNNQIYINAEFLATKIAHVDDVLYIGDSKGTPEAGKQIIFSDHARITNFWDGLGVPTGLEISASKIKLEGGPLDLSGCTSIDFGDNAVSVSAKFG